MQSDDGIGNTLVLGPGAGGLRRLDRALNAAPVMRRYQGIADTFVQLFLFSVAALIVNVDGRRKFNSGAEADGGGRR